MNPIRSIAISLFIASTVAVAFAQGERYVTITVGPVSSGQTTNRVAISATETAEVVSYESISVNGYLVKDGVRFGISAAPDYRTVVHGPADFVLETEGTNPNNCGFLTIKVIPDAAPPANTVIIPGDTKGAQIIMESSPDLVAWTDAVPGVYQDVGGHLFFRIRAVRTQ